MIHEKALLGKFATANLRPAVALGTRGLATLKSRRDRHRAVRARDPWDDIPAAFAAGGVAGQRFD
jgi:hypothetical protein